ncbi:predicted membrane protein [Hahella chejuensis KCTC 2396]|uniref:Predicted membrane protein n=1 Tax=Hahella chejuensis (strain KCTC 2396) TaxID=349521 RepID=Q2SKQ0_HAHCH|nr:DUF2238 domain-containing protein [Hahella chejuensis]ABC28774.1 predicted membrane protein [Hahella chejuensis KCTC 2396]
MGNGRGGAGAGVVWILIFLGVLVWSGLWPKDRFIWLLEVAPAIIAAFILAFTYKRFPLTPLLYWLILVPSVILMVGGHYTYAEVPLFDRIGEIMGWGRNNYDKVGHFAQGFIPAMVAREILLRLRVVKGRSWMNFFIVCIALAISAFYELIEWWVAVASGDSSVAFLGTQGYEWDTQSDMCYAMVGAISALLVLGRIHDRQLYRLKRAPVAAP